MPIRGLIWVVFFIGSLPFCFSRPFYGILLWTVVAFLNPQWYTWSAGEWLPWALLVAIPTIAGSLVFVRRWNWIVSRESFLILLLWIWFTFTTLVSTQSEMFAHHSADTWYQWQFVSKILLMAVMALPIVNTFAKLRIFVLTIAGCFGALVLKFAPFIIITAGASRLYGPPHSMIADNNDLGLALDMSLPLFFFIAVTERGWIRRIFGAICFMTVPGIFFTYSRGALVGLITVGLLMCMRLKQRWLLIPFIALVALAALMFSPEAWRERMNPTEMLDNSAKARLESWGFARKLAADSPITGGGFKTFTPELFAHYGYDTNNVHGPHSVYFQVLAEHGVVGLLLYLSLIASSFMTGRRVVLIARAQGNPILAEYANMFRFSLIGFLSAGAFLGRAYFDYTFSIIICLAILKKVADEAWPVENEVTDVETFDHGDGQRLLAGQGGIAV